MQSFNLRRIAASATLLLLLLATACSSKKEYNKIPDNPLSDVQTSSFAGQGFKEGEGTTTRLDGVELDAQGRLIVALNRTSWDTPNLWIANETDRSVTRQSTTDTGNFLTIPLTDPGTGQDCIRPSRTSVDSGYNAWVACRGQESYSSVSSTPSQTASGKSEAFPTIDDKVFHLSAQEGKILKVLRTGRAPRGLAIDAKGNLWVASSYDNAVWMFDKDYKCIYGAASQGCQNPPIPTDKFPYGAAVDKDQQLWIVHRFTGTLLRINTLTKSANPAGNAEDYSLYGPYVREDCEWSKVNYDMAPYDLRSMVGAMYALTIDKFSRIFVTGYRCGDVLKIAGRDGPDLDDPTGKVYKQGDLLKRYIIPGSMGMGMQTGQDRGETRGISIDLDFNLWVSDSARNKIFKLSNSSLAVLASFDAGNDSIGVGVDARGNIWAVDRVDNAVARYDAIGPTRTGAAMQFPVTGNYMNKTQPAPYTYSDMLGTLLNLITRGESRPLWTTIRELSPNKRWYKIYWELEEAGQKDGLVQVSVKCLKDLTPNALKDDREFIPVENGGDLPCKSDRYLQVKVQFDSDLAILKNLRVTERS